MDYEKLYTKYQDLLNENFGLKAEIERLKAQLVISKPQKDVSGEINTGCCSDQIPYQFNISKDLNTSLNNCSENGDKIDLFMSLFRGRDDVFAKRWQSKAGKSGYSPVCLNEWEPGVCDKPKVKCSECSQKLYAEFNEKIVEDHLRGNMVVGMYPLRIDETCYFLAIDFDDTGWQKDVSILRNVCDEFEISYAIERSRSGNGAHAWFFFENQISAALARKFGTALLTCSMSKRHEIKFRSYDRLFPNQDTIPKGGLGNLIALPLQMAARKNSNTVFIDENFEPYADQWRFLGGIGKLSEDNLGILITRLCKGNELGELRQNDDEIQRPWATTRVRLGKHDLPQKVGIVKSDMVYIPKNGFSQEALNMLKRLAAFNNPDFYRAQAMRMPTYNKPRIISCSEDIERYLCLPRGCEEEINNLLSKCKIDVTWFDETNHGRNVDVEFNGILRKEQQEVIDELLNHDTGVLSATTAFGKTVVAANLIAARKRSTLILVHRQQLLLQWVARLSEFLRINEELPIQEKKRGRKKKQGLIGQIGAGKDSLSAIIDVAIMQSLNNAGEVKECVKNYGMVIVDECHHVPAFSFEQILKKVNAKFVYGLTATPTRKDGHHPIIFMYCGAERFRVDAKKQAEKRPFDHYVIPRFTSFRIPIDENSKDLTIQELYAGITVDEIRNQMIVDDVLNSYENGRNSLVLSERTAHVMLLAKKLKERIPEVLILMGGMGAKKTREILNKISAISTGKQLTLVATGKFVGEGFDEPRLDTLFLAMPISWRGTLQQYAGRLHRLYESKKEVQVYDYVDIHVRMLEKMYGKRLNGYASIGYKVKGENIGAESSDIIFDKNSFLPVYRNDILSASKEVMIVSPFVTNKRVTQMLQYFNNIVNKQVKITVVTRPSEDFKDKRKQALEQIFDILRNMEIKLILRSNIHQKFAIIDQKTVWYGSINLLSFGSAEESIMRLVSNNIAYELMKNIEK
ncbi:MAG: DEAD/DEAH box helicase family protein [Candidatus Scalindua rubra]|uniref:Type III restriction enzyme, res subunit n=1 Tax=Candidatus Scalindua brodae TaxID=237368 RepID=A0A0B0ELK6_9BACT|nr:MAG: Type III restriction enzyme, res subunit [Candidatus Scalindua brodae]MBZ0110104.1 DEAD/DEAH box helicase family protein [Candidatus Scalindua rubra]